MNRRFRAAVASVVLLVTAASGTAHAARTATTNQPIGIVSQPFHITSPTTARFVLRLPADTPSGAIVRFSLQRRVAQRDSFRAIADRFAEPAVIDEVTFPLRQGVRNNGTISFDVLFTTDTVSVRDLSMPQDGIYPVAIQVENNATVLSSALTFLNRRTETAQVGVPTGIVASLTAPPSQSTDGSLALDDTVRAAVTQFISFLRGATGPLTLRIQPEIVAALARSGDALDAAMYSDLKSVMSGRSVVVAPFVREDAAALVADGLASELTAALKLGQQTLTKYLPGTTVHANTWIADESLDTRTLSVLRNLGMNAFILMPSAGEGTTREQEPAVLSRPAGNSSTGIAVQVVDDALAATIDAGTDDPERVGVRVAAEIIAQRDDLVSAGVPVDHIRLLVSSGTGDILGGGVLLSALKHLSGAPGISLTDLGGPQEVNERFPATVFPATTDRSVGGLRAGILQARTEVAAISSMLPAEDARAVSWSERLSIAVSPGTPDGAGYVGALRSEMRQMTSAVSLVTPENVTLSSRNGSIRLQVRNNQDSTLFVRVVVSSPKMSIAGQPDVVELLPNSTTDVKVPVRARSNGSFGVNVHVVTPVGRVQVVSPATVTAHVKAVAGLGQLVSITLLLVLVAWWWSHRRRTHRHNGAQGTVSAQ